MESSILLAKIFGTLFCVAAIGMLINQEFYRKLLTRFAEDPALTYFPGTLALAIGVLITHFHNLWVADWRIIITLLGWMALLKGVLLILFPELGAKVTKFYTQSATPLIINAVISLILGLVLFAKGFLI